MTDSEEYGDEENETSEQVSLSRAEHDDLRAKARKASKADDAVAEATEARKELAFVKAGIDTDSKIGKLMLRSYDGEMTVEAITTEAVELGIMSLPATDPETTSAEQASTDERAVLAAGAPADTAPVPNAEAQALKAGFAALSGGASEEAALGIAFAELVTHGVRGKY